MFNWSWGREGRGEWGAGEDSQIWGVVERV